MILRPATTRDLGFIRALVQRPENQHYLTDEDETALAAYAESPESRLLIWQDADGLPAGFALYCGIGNRAGTIELRRLALCTVGMGQGADFVRRLIRFAFDDLGAARLWLDASGENLRAQKVYERLGFTLEGRQRQQQFCAPLGRAVDVMLYGMMRAEWPG